MPEYKIWYKNNWYEHWPSPPGAVPTPNPTSTFATLADAIEVAEDNELYGARIYLLVAAPDGPTFTPV